MVRRGSTVRVRQRALQRPRKTGSFVLGATCTSRARSGVESVLEKRVLRPIPSRRLMERALEGRAMFDAHSEMGQRRWNALARAPERSSDARKAYARRVSEAGRDRRASSGGRATPHEGDHEARDRVGSQLGPEGQDSRSDSCGDARRWVEAGRFLQASREGHLHACRRSRRVGVFQAEEATGEAPPEGSVRKRSEADVAERSASCLVDTSPRDVRESLRQVLWAFGFAGLGVSGLLSRGARAGWNDQTSSTNARTSQFNARMTWSQSSRCSSRISRTRGIRSALRVTWLYPPSSHAR